MSKKLSGKLKAEDVFNPADFQSIRLDLFFTNTSGTTYNKGVEFSETGEGEVMLQVPPKSCVEKQNAQLIVYKGRKEHTSKPVLEVTGKITSLEHMPDGNMRITLQLVQYEDKQWRSFLSIFDSRQEEINAFMESMRR